MTTAIQHSTEAESRQLAEDSREQDWSGRAFIREMFLGNFELDVIHPFPLEKPWTPEFLKFYEGMKDILVNVVDSVEIDATGEYPPHVVDALRKIGAFGMKVPKEYGGLGLHQVEYNRVMEMVGSMDGNICALLSAHQSIGVPQPLKLFGSPELKKKYLPRCAAGAISAFALTEPHVGSDPASLSTTAEPSEDGKYFILNGEKLWCTNGTLAELLVVMARNPKTKKISAFVVETGWEGVVVQHRCRFMGLKALANAVITFSNVKVPRENIIGDEGKGLKIALVTLNTGRLTLPAASAGGAKRSLEILRHWCNERNQWGVPVGKHEAISHQLADMAATTWAMDSVSDLCSQMADRGGYDIRLEAAAAKEWNTVRGWELIDRTLQIRGGRGYETEKSLKERGEFPAPVERVMRDCRINLIFEGSSEIMHLFMAREAVDKHLQVAGAMINPKSTVADKMKAMPTILGYYAKWYPPLWLKGLVTPFAFADWGRLAPQLRFIERSCRRLARNTFHGMAIYQAKMERKQAFLFRAVDIVMELFAMAATVSRTRALLDAKSADGQKALELTELFCANSRMKIERLFEDLWSNNDAIKNKVAAQVLKYEHKWMEEGIIDIGVTNDAIRPKAIMELRKQQAAEEPRLAAAS